MKNRKFFKDTKRDYAYALRGTEGRSDYAYALRNAEKRKQEILHNGS